MVWIHNKSKWPYLKTFWGWTVQRPSQHDQILRIGGDSLDWNLTAWWNCFGTNSVQLSLFRKERLPQILTLFVCLCFWKGTGQQIDITLKIFQFICTRHLPNFSSFAPVPFLCQTTSLLIALDINVEHSCNITHHAVSLLLLWTMTWMFNISSHTKGISLCFNLLWFQLMSFVWNTAEETQNCFLATFKARWPK